MMKDNINIFVIESRNADTLMKIVNKDIIKLSLEELLKKKEKFENSILFFEDKLDIECDIIEKIISLNPGLSIMLFYEKQIDSSVIADYYNAGISEDTPVHEQNNIEQLLERYSKGSDESGLNYYNNLIEEFKKIGIISKSLKMAEVFSDVKKISRSNSTVLISGESGTGKEEIAKSIHYFSKQSDHNFVGINTGAIPENLLEVELFGHVKGAFTSALKDRKGKFEYADKGSIFLDEISNMPQSLQVKLLRILQEREFERLGDNTPVKVDVRVIAATNKDLKDMIKDGEFREDLYFRLNVIPINLPPLRERKEDIPELANYFARKYCAKDELDPKTFSMSALRILKEFSWPGNIRHLENTIERMVVLNPDKPILSHKEIPEEIIYKNTDGKQVDTDISIIPDDGIPLNNILKNIERKYIMQSLEKTSGNKQKAAKLLNIKRTTLIEKLRKM